MPPDRPDVPTGPFDAAALPFRTVNHYELLSRIGAGGMGEVYLARDARLDRYVGVKLLWPHLAMDPVRLRRFEVEAQTVSSLNHPHILIIHDVGVVKNRPYLVTEFVEGETLRARLNRGALPVAAAVDIMAQVASALAAAHARNIIHRDLKPENVMVRPDGYVKVLDFGIAKLAAGSADSATRIDMLRTEPGMVLGTLPYMSPEQTRGIELDVRTDVWSIGVMLYELLSGSPPFAGHTPSDLIAAILRHDPISIGAAVPAVPPALDRVVMKTLRKARADRHDSARDLYADLQQVKHELDAPTHSAVAEERRPEHLDTAVPIRKRRRRALKSLAVLPLRNLSGSPQEDYFSDGMTEALIANLAQISSLRVISRTSAMRYKDSVKPLPEIARELNVDAIIEGSALASGDRVRITAQLIDAGSDSHVWARTYERELRDVLDLQNEVARSIVDEIRLTVTPGERARLRRIRQIDPEAYHLYLRGRFHWHKRNEENLRRAMEYFHQALTRDPGYADAYAGLADTYVLLGFHLGVLAPHEWSAAARMAAERALQIDSGLAAAHNSLAISNLQRWDWDGAGREFRRSIQLNPNDPVAHNWFGNYLAALGRFSEAIDTGRRAMGLDPLTVTWNMGLGHFYYLAREYDKAIEQELKTLEMDSSFYMTYWILGLAYEQKGQLSDSVAAFEKAANFSGGTAMRGLLGRAYALLGRTAEASAVVEELSRRAERTFVPPDVIGLVHAGLGDQDRAIDLLLRGCETPSFFSVMFVKVSPVFDSLRSHRRFHELLRRTNLETAA